MRGTAPSLRLWREVSVAGQCEGRSFWSGGVGFADLIHAMMTDEEI